jgi:hypothetical protein
MTISTTIIKNSYSGNGSTTAFTYNFKIAINTEIEVIVKTNATGAESIRSLGSGSTNYGVSGVGNNSGTVTFVTAPLSTETVVLRRSTAQTQAMDLIDNDPMSAGTIETAHDKAIAISQELQEQLNRSIKISKANTMTSTEFTVSATDRANKILAFDSSGEISVTQELGTYKGTSATTTTATFVQRDIVKSTTAAQLNNVYICVADSAIGDTLTDTDHFALLVDAVSAATSATAAAASAVDATNNGAAKVTLAAAQVSLATTQANNSAASASTASGHKDTASTKASEAASSATASANSATASANSATASANSATAAAASLDSFDDTYLGSKSSAPSTDNDGNALATGALYYNSSAGNLNVWSGSAWVAIQADTDVKVSVSANDTTPNFLLSKFTAGANISLTETNNGGNETITITNTGEDPTALAIALG